MKKKKKKENPGDIIILHKCTENHNHQVWFLRYGVTQTEFFVILDHFCHFTPLTTGKIKIKKKGKNTMRCHHFTHVYQKSQSCRVFQTALRGGEWGEFPPLGRELEILLGGLFFFTWGDLHKEFFLIF